MYIILKDNLGEIEECSISSVFAILKEVKLLIKASVLEIFYLVSSVL